MRPNCYRAPIVFSFLVSLAATPALPAQEVLNWDDFELCEDCQLEITELVRLGAADGPGIIESATSLVVWNEGLGYLVSPMGGTGIKVFDQGGRFVQVFGREGDGPGEFRSITDVDVIDGQIVVLDSRKRALVILSLEGQYITEHSYRFQPGRFTPVGGGRIVVTSTNWRSRVIDHPLHLVDLSSGATILEFGAANAGGELTDVERNFGGMVQGSVASRPGTVWWGAIPNPAVQEWSLEGEFVRTMEGELPWFPAISEFPDRSREPPPTTLRSLALDAEDRLWMMVSTADPEWDEVETIQTPEGAVTPVARIDDARDMRLDIFDLGERRHLGRYVWDQGSARILNRGGALAVTVLEYDDAMVPQMVVYEVRVGEAR